MPTDCFHIDSRPAVVKFDITVTTVRVDLDIETVSNTEVLRDGVLTEQARHVVRRRPTGVVGDATCV